MLMEKINLHTAYGAIMIIDGHFGRPIVNAVLGFNGQTIPYRAKADGYYVLTRPVPLGAVCRIDCPGYTPLNLAVEHDENGRFFALAALNHMAGNPQLRYTRKLLGWLGVSGGPLPAAAFTLALAGRMPALMVIEAAEAGAMAIRLNTEGETRLIGQKFYLPDQPQACVMITGLEGADNYLLKEPLPVALEQGLQLTPFWELATDHKGEFVFPYKPHLMREEKAELSITCGKLNQTYTVHFPAGADGLLSAELPQYQAKNTAGRDK